MAAYEFWRVGVEYTAGTVTDITQYVDTVRGPISATTGATRETTGEPASLSLVLNNIGLRFTSGSLALTTGMKISLWETIGYSTFYLFTGYVEFPEIDDANVSSTQDQQISVYAVDQLARWSRTETYRSTLAGHILGVGGTDLVAYWPCLEQGGGFQNIGISTKFPAMAEAFGLSGTSVVAQSGQSQLEPAQSPDVLADDAPTLHVDAAFGTSGGVSIVARSPDMRARLGTNVYTVPAGYVVTVVGWYYSEVTTADAGQNLIGVSDTQGSATVNMALGGQLQLIALGTLTSVVQGRNLPYQGWVPIAIRYGWDTALIELWMGRDRYTGVLAGTPSGSNAISDINMATFYTGGLAHVQVYVAPSTNYTNTKFVAQYDFAQKAGEWQTTGARINMLADWAGFPSAARDVSTGASVMQRAALSGLTVADAMDVARQTEQGDLFMSGDGRLVFRERPYINNV